MLAYLLVTLQETATAPMDEPAAKLAQQRLVTSLREVWPGFDYRNIGSEARAYFQRTFPVASADVNLMVRRYINPIVATAPEATARISP